MLPVLILLVVVYLLFKFFNNPNNLSGISQTARSKLIAAGFTPIGDNYKTFEELQAGLRKAGLESSNLIVGIDFTKSNEWTGQKTFGGKCLHDVSLNCMNPYQTVIRYMGQTLEPFDDDKLIPAFGFGDASTTAKSVFSFLPKQAPCQGFQQVLERYSEIVPTITLSGPTNFAPLIRKAIQIVKQEKR